MDLRKQNKIMLGVGVGIVAAACIAITCSFSHPIPAPGTNGLSTEDVDRELDAILRTYNISKACYNPDIPPSFLLYFNEPEDKNNPYFKWFMTSKIRFRELTNKSLLVIDWNNAVSTTDSVYPDITGLNCKSSPDSTTSDGPVASTDSSN